MPGWPSGDVSRMKWSASGLTGRPAVDPAELLVDVARWERQPQTASMGMGVIGSGRVQSMNAAPYVRSDGSTATVMVVVSADHPPGGAAPTRLRQGTPIERVRHRGVVLDAVAGFGWTTVSWRHGPVGVHVGTPAGQSVAVELGRLLADDYINRAGPPAPVAPLVGAVAYATAVAATVWSAWPRRNDRAPRVLTAAAGGGAAGFAVWWAGAFEFIVAGRRLGLFPLSGDARLCAAQGAAIGAGLCAVATPIARRWPLAADRPITGRRRNLLADQPARVRSARLRER